MTKNKVRDLIIGAGHAVALAPRRGGGKPVSSDAEALRSDWSAIGHDIRAAMKKCDVQAQSRQTRELGLVECEPDPAPTSPLTREYRGPHQRRANSEAAE